MLWENKKESLISYVMVNPHIYSSKTGTTCTKKQDTLRVKNPPSAYQLKKWDGLPQTVWANIHFGHNAKQHNYFSNISEQKRTFVYQG